MNLFDKDGWVDIKSILNLGLPFNLVIGGRGTGKTYTTLKYVLDEDVRFMFMRRTQSQADLVGKQEFSPFKQVARDRHTEVNVCPITKYNSAFYLEDGNLPIGYTCALSTISNIRGFDASDVTLLIYDEFIPEKHERPIRNEGLAFLNAYETINRNRELVGKSPVQVIALANSNDIGNPIFMEFGIINAVEKTMRKGKNCWIDEDRGIGVFILANSPISKKKADTVLYKLSNNNDFAKMALDNDFVDRDYTYIKQLPLVEHIPIVSVGELTVYKHKTTRKLYVSTHRTGSPKIYSSGSFDLQRFRKSFYWIWTEYLCQNVYFEEILCEILLTKYFK